MKARRPPDSDALEISFIDFLAESVGPCALIHRLVGESHEPLAAKGALLIVDAWVPVGGVDVEDFLQEASREAILRRHPM